MARAGIFIRTCSPTAGRPPRHIGRGDGVAELLIGSRSAFITGADFLVDGGATAPVFFYGPLKT